jgi:hypothetical protein
MPASAAGEDVGGAMTRVAEPAEAHAGLSEVAREANREAYLLAVDGGAEPEEELDLACACGRPACRERLLITVGAYLRVHADPDRFVVFPGHADRKRGVVVDHGPVYEVVSAFRGAGGSS